MKLKDIVLIVRAENILLYISTHVWELKAVEYLSVEVRKGKEE